MPATDADATVSTATRSCRTPDEPRGAHMLATGSPAIPATDGSGRAACASTPSSTAPASEWSDDAALAALPDLLSPARRRDLGRPGRGVARAGRRGRHGPRLHPLIVEDILEGNQRAKIETTDGVVHIVLFHLTYDDEAVASEMDIVLGKGFLLTAHDGSLGPSRVASTCGPGSSRSSSTARITCCGRSRTTSSTATSRSPTSSATRSTRSRTRSIREATPETLEQLFMLKRELILVRRAISPVREVFNQLTNRDDAAHRRRRAASTSATSTTT